MGGTIGGSAADAAKSIQRQKYAADEKAKAYKRQKVDPLTEGVQENIGEASSDAFNSFQMGMEGLGDFVERNTRSLMPGGGDPDVQTTDTTTRNYTSASTSKSGGKGNKKSKKTSEGGTGGSKSQFYA